MEIKLSIVIPVYNVENHIYRCLKSILNQNVKTSLYEIIIVDDETPDNSINIIKENFINIENIKIISQQNKGLGGARNTGILNSNGKYVWFIDSDDDIPDNILKKILEELTTESDIYTFNYNKISESKTLKQISYKNELLNIKGCDIVSFFLISQVWKNIYKKDFLLRNKLLFTEHFLHEDGEFNMRAVTLADKITYKNIVIYNYYTNNQFSITNNIKIKNQQDLLSYIASAESLKSKNNLDTKQRECIDKYLINMLGVLFKNAIFLNDNDFSLFKNLIRKKRNDISSILKNQSIKDYVKGLSLLFILSKNYYKFVYFKSIN